ncbi:histone H1, sperm-like [Saccoglossus kowalevskii]|uniref:Sperm-specific protein PHI-2B/PHI-3-like n=1 Tax=Saccoglossus kowalevskii TaxID=10224 RepID=A0ABM0GMN7_SACKO|nr:PREDICTED: sperm-specific protein PHI-2B/PHI-3-like [Saccoglossus kowalevskii]
MSSSGSPKKKKMAARKKRATPSHPKTIDMVVAAITAQKERKGSSAQSIRNYIRSNFSVPASHLNSMVRRALKSGLESGVLVRPKGDDHVGVTGRFRVGKPAAKPRARKAAKKKTPKKKPRARKPKAKKAKSPKKKAKKAKSPKKSAKPKKPRAKKPAAKKPKAKKRSPKKKSRK